MKLKTMKTLALLMVVLVLFTAACASAEPAPATPTEPSAVTTAAAEQREVRIALVVPETGFLAVQGEELTFGVEIAIEQWNQTHETTKAVLEVCDDEGVPERSLSCVQRLGDSVTLFSGPHYANSAVAIQPMISEQGLFVISSNIVTIPDVDTNYFLSNTTFGQVIDGMFDYFEDQGFSKIGLLAVEDATGDAAVGGFEERAPARGFEFAAVQFRPDAESAVPEINRLLAEEPEIIVAWTVGPTGVTALRGIRDTGTDTPVLMLTVNATPSTFELAADAISGINPDQLLFYASDSLVPEAIEDPDRRQRMETFIELYTERHGTFPPWVAFTGADSIAVAMEAAHNAESLDPAAMTEYLESGAQVPGYHIAYFQYSPESHVNTAPNQLQPIVWRSGEWALP